MLGLMLLIKLNMHCAVPSVRFLFYVLKSLARRNNFSFFVIFLFFFHEQSGTFSRDESLFSTVCLRLLIFSFIEALSIGRHTRIRPIIKNNHESNYRSLILYAVI